MLFRSPVSFEITSEEKSYLRKLSRKTWAYFEDFVNNENNWLGPDNYQEDPPNGVAHRTSPTNMGMELTSNLVAYDLGYVGIVNVTSRIDKIMTSMEDMDMYKGHFYNWYDTKTKAPLFPKYVSTVDSGNLVGYLWVVAQALDEYLSEPVFNLAKIEGLADTMKLASEDVEVSKEVKSIYQGVLNKIASDKIDFNCWKIILRDLYNKIAEVGKNEYCMQSYWNKKLKDDVDGYLEEISELFPWFDYAFDKNTDIELTESMRFLLEEATIISIPEKTTNILDKIGRAHV